MVDENLQNSLRTLLILSIQMGRIVKLMETVYNNPELYNPLIINVHGKDFPIKEMLLKNSTDQYILQLVAFLDEWNTELTPLKIPEYSSKILKLKKLAKPILKKIKTWTGVDSYRNILIAHNHKINGVSIFQNTTPVHFKVPNDLSEFILIDKLVTYLMALTVGEFKDESVLQMKFDFYSFFDFPNNPVNVQSEFFRIKQEVDQIINEITK